MLRSTSRPFFLPGLLLFVALLAGSVHAEDPPTLVLDGLDPIVLLGGKEKKGSPDLHFDHEGFRYRFVTEENRKAFAADPEKYRVHGAGSCIVIPSATAEPDVFTVYDGRIYILGSWGCVEKFDENPEQYLSQETGARVRTVAIVLWDGVELLDFAGPGEVFSAADGFRVFTVARTTDPIVSQGFVSVNPRYSIESCPEPDIVLLPGGGVQKVRGDEAMMEWIRTTSQKAELMLSVCTGAFLLADAGLLDDREATTYHGAIDDLARVAKKTKVHRDRRFVDNGPVVTSAGVSAGIDMALHVVARLKGLEVARKTAEYMEYRWTPDKGRAYASGR